MDEEERRIKAWKELNVKANGLTLQMYLKFCDEWEEICEKLQSLKKNGE